MILIFISDRIKKSPFFLKSTLDVKNAGKSFDIVFYSILLYAKHLKMRVDAKRVKPLSIDGGGDGLNKLNERRQHPRSVKSDGYLY